jgi:hypothetical protein
MARKRRQNKIAESRLALPLAAIYGVLTCLAYGVAEKQLWVQLACLSASTLLMAALNNINALIRVYSRMVSCSFLFLSVMAIFLLPSMKTAIVQLCLIGFYLSTFKSYLNTSATGWIFYAFFSLGMASIVFVQILYFVPILWLLIIINIKSFSLRGFVASILGLMIPYWLICGYFLYTKDYSTVIRHFRSLGEFAPLGGFQLLTQHQLITLAWVIFLFIVGMIHFIRNSYYDKIRTRMFFEVFITIGICCIVFLVLQPQYYNCLTGMLIVNTAPLIGHFIALTQTKFTNFSFHLILLITVLLTFYNIWMPSMIF